MSTFFVLASSSKSRLAILNKLGYKADLVLSPDIDETKHRSESPKELSMRLSKQKAFSAYNVYFSNKDLQNKQSKKIAILSADTVCAIGRRVIDKAMTKDDVKNCLTALSGRNHRVYTSISLLQIDTNQTNHDNKESQFFNSPTNSFDISYLQQWIKKYRFFNLKQNLPEFVKISSKCVETRIKFKQLSPEEIDRFLDSQEGLYNAGGYTISGIAESFVVNMIGSYSSVIGLPTYQTTNMLTSAGVFAQKL